MPPVTGNCSRISPSMQTLVLDTSGPYTTVLIALDGNLSTACILHNRPAEHLHQQIQTSLKTVSIRPTDLDRIGIVRGPGSWTGLNIGITAAKTLSHILNIPLVPIRTLDVLVATSPKPAWALMHAGRDRCYYARHTLSGSKEIHVASIDSIDQQIRMDSSSVRVLEYGDIFQDRFRNDSRYQAVQRLFPEWLIAALKYSPCIDTESARALTPEYLQPSHAEQDIQKKLDLC